jgi:hypothetical protein
MKIIDGEARPREWANGHIYYSEKFEYVDGRQLDALDDYLTTHAAGYGEIMTWTFAILSEGYFLGYLPRNKIHQ